MGRTTKLSDAALESELPQMVQEPFRISTGLKDLIGRNLITNDFVAVFELVKNSFDAHAREVRIYFDDNRIVISDNGKGMSQTDILEKWLFVAYSAKRDGTEDKDYRSKIGQRNRPYAGAKGVGRFSCDRLGKRLVLSSRAKSQPVQVLKIDWTLYEREAKQEFGDIEMDLEGAADFPGSASKPRGTTGTILEITDLRSDWTRDKLLALKRELAKLINPFADGPQKFQIDLLAPQELDEDQRQQIRGTGRREEPSAMFIVNGKVENTILEVLKKRTTSIHIQIIEEGKIIESELDDRGESIYKIREVNPYFGLSNTELDVVIYFLNRGAKKLFAHRMGLPSVQFGSIFLFRNGFRVFPIGQEDDDFFGLSRRKQQGMRRFLGSRDLIGRIELRGVDGFDEATSRDQGLIRTPQVEELIDCVRDKCVRRLERYVVDITWKDQFDKDVSDTSRMRLDESSALITQLVSRLAATQGVELVEYNPELVRIVDEKSSAFEHSLKALEVLAERTGDDALLARVGEAANRIAALEAAEAEAREAERRAEARAAAAVGAASLAQSRYGEERERNQFLVAAASLDHDTILNLHHQIIMHASDVHLGVKRMMGKLRTGKSLNKEEWIDFLERVSFRNSQILTASRFATKGGYKQQAAKQEADLPVYICDYITTVSSLWAPRGIEVEICPDGKRLERSFRPIDIGIVIDNLISNAAKARASRVAFILEVARGANPALLITVADNGIGWPSSMDPIDRVFEKGVTTTDGSGLGLYHLKSVIEGLGGLVEAKREPYSEKLCGAQLSLRIPS